MEAIPMKHFKKKNKQPRSTFIPKAVLILVDEENRIGLLQSSQDSNLWQLPETTIHPKETLEASLTQDCMNEFNLEIENLMISNAFTERQEAFEEELFIVTTVYYTDLFKFKDEQTQIEFYDLEHLPLNMDKDHLRYIEDYNHVIEKQFMQYVLLTGQMF